MAADPLLEDRSLMARKINNCLGTGIGHATPTGADL
jgi:hypothetical protein